MKRLFSAILILSMLVLLFASCGKGPVETEPTYATTPQTTSPTRPPEIVTEWEAKYEPKKYDPKAASVFGFSRGSYEYDFFQSLCGISFFAFMSENAVSNARNGQWGDDFVGAYVDGTGTECFTAPYGDILRYAYAILMEAKVAKFSGVSEIIAYQQKLPSTVHAVENLSPLALSFSKYDEKLTELATALLALSEKYPEYRGEFALSDAIKEEARALIDACKPVREARPALLESWTAYYKAEEPIIEVTEEFVPEHNAVKITVSGEGKLLISNIQGKYIDNYRYDKVEQGGKVGYAELPMDAPVTIYLPLSVYMEGTTSFKVRKLHKVENYIYEQTVTLGDFGEYISDAPIIMSDKFLDAALRKYFDGDYSERDLLRISVLNVSYTIKGLGGMPVDPTVTITTHTKTGSVTHGGVSKTYFYSEFFTGKSSGTAPAGLREDLLHFHGLNGVSVSQEPSIEGQSMNPIEKEYLDALLPYEVTVMEE